MKLHLPTLCVKVCEDSTCVSRRDVNRFSNGRQETVYSLIRKNVVLSVLSCYVAYYTTTVLCVSVYMNATHQKTYHFTKVGHANRKFVDFLTINTRSSLSEDLDTKNVMTLKAQNCYLHPIRNARVQLHLSSFLDIIIVDFREFAHFSYLHAF